jgi:3-oxoacyl-[acyl-carrier-protein] synthase-3
VTSDLALAAAKEALKRAGRKPEDVDLVILGTTSPDYIAPNTAVVLQHKLGAKNAGTFDVDCACAAFPAQVAIAAGLIATNAVMKTVLVVGVDMIHRLSDSTDPGIFLWGDGAGAAVMEAGDWEGFIGAAFQADGTYAFGWGIAAGGTSSRRASMRSRVGAPRCVVKRVTIPPRSMKIIGHVCSSACATNAASPQTRWTN